MSSNPPNADAYRASLLQLQEQQQARLAALTEQVEGTLGANWQQGVAATPALYGPLLDQYAKDLNALRLANDDPAAALSLDWLTSRNPQLASIEASVKASLDAYAQQSTSAVTMAQASAAGIGTEDAAALTQQSLWPAVEGAGVPPAMLFNRPNPDALAQWVGRAGNGHPLGNLFANFSAEATTEARKAMMLGLATGQNPKAMASGIANAMDISRSRATIIARTEVLGSYRAAAHETYRANSDVLNGWIWSAGGNNPCAMCAGMDGLQFGLEESLDDHPCGKCSPIPMTKSWDDILGPLGIDTSDMADTSMGAEGAYTSFSDKFASLPASQQRAIIGTKTGYEAYRRGEVTLQDFIGKRPAADGWPAQYYQKSLREMQIPTRQGLHVTPSDYLTHQVYREPGLGTIGNSQIGPQRMPPWARQTPASQMVYQILRNGLPVNFPEVLDRPVLTEALRQMLESDIPANVRAAVERQLTDMGAALERLPLHTTAGWQHDIDALLRGVIDRNYRITTEDYFANGSLRSVFDALHARAPDQWRNIRVNLFAVPGRYQQVIGPMLDEIGRLNAEELAALANQGIYPTAVGRELANEIADRVAQELTGTAVDAAEAAAQDAATLAARDVATTATQDGFAIREPSLTGPVSDVQAQRDALSTQRANAQAKLDTLSASWRDLVLKTAEFDPEDDAEELAALEARISRVEAQQGAQLAKMDKLDQQIAALDKKLAEVTMPPSDRVAMLRSQIDENMAQRETFYGRQHDLVEQQTKLQNMQNSQEAAATLERAELQAKYDLYRQTLDVSNPDVKRYLKDYAAWNKNEAVKTEAAAEQQRLERLMDSLSLQGKKASGEYAQAREDFKAAEATYSKAQASTQKLWTNLWNHSVGVYKPELDSIGGAENRFRQMGLVFKAEDIANHPLVLAAQERFANIDARIADLTSQIRALEQPMSNLNREIDRELTQLRDLHATLSDGTKAFDSTRPFSDVIALPEGHQPPNALMNKIDYRMHEPREITKTRIIDNIATKLKDDPAWAEYVSRMPFPDNLGIYHAYVPSYATARDTKSAKLVADIMRKWGVAYKPGSPTWVAMQTAVNDEFGLDATLHVVNEAGLRAGMVVYEQDGAAMRALVRAMYDNTQQWFADNGIEEVEIYRGFGWTADSSAVPQGVDWGTLASQNHGVADMELNPFQSFSADINISQGTTAAGGGFAGAGFSGGSDYSLLIGAKVPVDRVLSTAQTGFGAKLESELVVMGRASDTVAYRAGTRVESALLRDAEEQAAGERGTLYKLADGTQVHVAANTDGTFTVSYLDGPQPKVGTLKLGGSKTYKTEAGVNKSLASFRISNTYTAPISDLAVQEGETAAERVAADAALTTRIDSISADASVADMQDWIRAQIPGIEQVNLTALDPQAARLVANATGNIIPELPEVANNLWRIEANATYSDALAFVPRDGLSLILNTDKWTDLAGIAERAPQYFAQGWWVGQTPEQIIGHEVGHLVQLNYNISNDTWVAAMDKVAAAGGNPLVSQYAGDKIEESFAETFALLVYGEPTDAQIPIAQEMARLLNANGIDYAKLRMAVGSPRFDLP